MNANTERQVLTSFEDVREAAVMVASCAKRNITIQTPDLENGIYDSEPFLEALKHLLLSKRYAKVRILITDPGRTVRNGNRLVALARRLNTYIEFRNLHEEFRGKITDAFIIADETAVLYRSNGRRFEGMAGTREPLIARQHLEQFEKPWEESTYEQTMPVTEI
jgi:hypothetical protein